MVRFAKSRQGMSFVGILKLGVAVIQCILSSRWTGYMLVEVWHDFSEVGFVEVPRDDGGCVRVFIDEPLSSSWSLDRVKLVSACGGM